jgi:hypothetical protein
MYLFLVRAFNDIDHITPVVWKMSRDNYPVAVYCINPEYDIQSDYRLNYLKELGVEVDLIYNHFDQNLGRLHRIMRRLMLRSFAVKKQLDAGMAQNSSVTSRMLGPLARAAGIMLYMLMRLMFYNKSWAQNILERSGVKVLCFDWMRPNQFVGIVLLAAAKNMSIPTLALPHGVFIYTNDSIAIESRPMETFEKLNRYDYVIVQNKLYREIMTKSGLDKTKIHLLGSARYCNEWVEQNKKISPRKIIANSKNATKLKIVFMTTKVRWRVNTERMLKTLEMLSNYDGIELLIKPHTRTKKEATLYESLPLPNVSNVSSVELCEWADVVMVIGSSIILEPLIQGKPVLYLKYLHANTTLYEEFGACWTIHNEEELKKALSSLQTDRKTVPYSDEDVRGFIADIVYGGPQKRDVLKDYEQFIMNCAPAG